MVLVDEGKHMDNNHPMHMHGYNFRVVAMEKVNFDLLIVFEHRYFHFLRYTNCTGSGFSNDF